MQQLTSAINFATIAHQNQRRKNLASTPYINHPIEVMDILSQAGIADIDILCAAVLHDTIEDCGVSYDDICNNFGFDVANIVKECSDDKSLPKKIRKQQQIIHARNASIGAKIVKSADKLSNLRSLDVDPPSFWTAEEIDGYFVWSFHVWNEAKGHLKKLDEQLEDLFRKRGMFDISQDELEKRLHLYYQKME